MIFNKDKRRKFKKFCIDTQDNKTAKIIQKNYSKIIQRIKNKQGKIKVLFLVSENSKWKAQSLYDLMAESEKFEPIIALTQITKTHHGKDNTRNELKENYDYFSSKKMNVLYAYENNKYIDLKDFEPDIIFYQQPWYISSKQSPQKTSKYALLCYIPYYVMNYGGEMDYSQPLHKYLFRHYILNKDWADLYSDLSGLKNFVPTGHTMLDAYILNKNKCKKNYVIYAPHYSFPHPKNENAVNYGTFLKNGYAILEYAKAHSEINWAFKPHPQLKFSLLKSGITPSEVEEYYTEWETIGTACYDSSYMNLFINSQALITDCASFLTEYFCSQKPIIHLISSECKIKPMTPSLKIFDTFYNVHNLEEMYDTFEKVLIQKQDPLKNKRLKTLKESKLLDNYAAKNIMKDLEKVFFD